MIIDTSNTEKKKHLGINKDGYSYVYIARKDTPEKNVKSAVSQMGGIESIIDINDVVIVKPNAQWWNQGTTNTNNIKGFIELVLDIPGFQGEIVIMENHHYLEPNSRGWTTKKRNGDYNLNELIKYFNDLGCGNVTKYHLIDAGPNPEPKQGNAFGGEIVTSVEEGDGYIWEKNNIYISPENRKCMMTYPVFTSQFSGKKIDLKKGTYQNGKYIKNVKLINFSCLNHHSSAFGVTASIKNLMGIPDMTCGYHGIEPKGYFNMHYIGRQSYLYKLGIDLKYYSKKIGFGKEQAAKVKKAGYWNSQYTGGALGYWMKTIKIPDLNILAAEYVGWGGRGRHSTKKRHHANCVAISTDPVALDYIGAKQILLTSTPEKEDYYKKLNDPDNSTFNKFLLECNKQGIGNLSPGKIKVIRG